jgi:uncharacterized protein (DUF608 family)
MSDLLFQNGPHRQWREFPAQGYENPVCGVVFGAGECTRGVPLGGIGTGCVDLNADGTLGLCSIFHSFAPPRELKAPLLELGLEGRSEALVAAAKNGAWCRNIHYWGHYPIADLEYELNAPVGIGVRAWSPFIPGDADISNTPAIFFDVTVRNTSSKKQSGTVACCFPGPSEGEAKSCARSEFTPHGGRVQWGSGSYVLVGDANARLMNEGPEAQLKVAVDFDLAAGKSKEFRFCLAWYLPRWAGSDAHHFRHAYAGRFKNVDEVVRFANEHRDSWLRRIIRWQSEIYATKQFPVWLRDQLVNVLHTITEDSFWAGESIPAENWYRPLGLFGLTESPRTTPHVCNPSDWYGILPVVFFFPQLVRSLLRLYVHFQLPTGEIPLGVGDGADLFHPVHHLFQVMNSCVHIQLIDRLWQRDRDAEILREFYPSALKALTFLEQWDHDGDGLPELDSDPIPNQFYGAWPWYGVAVHVSGFWIAALGMMERMATASGDTATAAHVLKWRAKAQTSLEAKLWNGNSYFLFHDLPTNKQSDTIMANQLAGQWCTRLHGLPGVFPEPRIASTLATIESTCVKATRHGALNSVRPDGTLDHAAPPHSDGIFTGECLCLAATLIYEGRKPAGEQIAERLMNAIVLQDGVGWELPNILNRDGHVLHGVDFYQMMILWALPLALEGQDIAGSCATEGFVGRILTAAAHD